MSMRRGFQEGLESVADSSRRIGQTLTQQILRRGQPQPPAGMPYEAMPPGGSAGLPTFEEIMKALGGQQ